jgi:hypothetical protein
MTASAKPEAVPVPRKRGPIQRTRIQHEGQVYGYTRVVSMIGPWSGAHETEYEVLRLCCGTSGRMSHSELTNARSFRSKRCSRCAGDPAAIPGVPSAPSGGHAHVVYNRQEVLGLLEQQAQERAAVLERVAARRAQAEAARHAAFERALGHPPSGRPDFDVPLPLPTVPERSRKSRRRG